MEHCEHTIQMNAQIPNPENCVPFHPNEMLSILREAPFPWWITGGWALDLFLGRQTRPHFDTDVAIARRNQLTAQRYLDKWEFYSTKRDKNGKIVLRPWETGETLGDEFPGVWARESEDDPWRFEFHFHEIDEDLWTFRYSDEIQHQLLNIEGVSSERIPYLLPEIALLYKAARLRDVDEQDFRQVLPHLNHEQRQQLSIDLKKFNARHPWFAAL